MKLSLSLSLLMLAALAGPARPAALPLYPPTTAAITVPLALERFAQLDRGLDTLSATFRQTVRSEDTGQAQTVEGTLAYRKGGRLRIEHRVPEPQTLVCDGELVWVWRPANGQVIRTHLKEWKKSQPLAQGLLDFGNYAELFKRYDVALATVAAPAADGYRSFALDLKPLPASGKAEDFTLTLRLSTRDYFPFDSDLRAGAVSARTILSDVRFNPAIPETMFRFSPPAGADVLDFSTTK